MANVDPTPKQRFMESGDNVTKHRRLLEAGELQRGFDYALMEYQNILSREVVSNPATAGGPAFRMAGALELISVFKRLAETPVIMRQVPNDNLNQKV